MLIDTLALFQESNGCYQMNTEPLKTLRFIDLFCGIGGFRYAMEAAAKKHKLAVECMFSSDIDEAHTL